MKLHETFFERDYPDPQVLRDLYRRIERRPLTIEQLRQEAQIPSRPGRRAYQPAAFDIALEKLVIHGAARLERDMVRLGDNTQWCAAYIAQRTHRQAQLGHMTRLTEAHGCTMVQLVRHFGDLEDSGADCGICDVCAPGTSLLHQFRAATPNESAHARAILSQIPPRSGIATGALYRKTVEGNVERRQFERLLSALARAGLIRTEVASFEKDGREIVFSKVFRIDSNFDPQQEEAPLDTLVIAESLMTEDKAATKRTKKKSTRAKRSENGQNRQRPPRTRLAGQVPKLLKLCGPGVASAQRHLACPHSSY